MTNNISNNGSNGLRSQEYFTDNTKTDNNIRNIEDVVSIDTLQRRWHRKIGGLIDGNPRTMFLKPVNVLLKLRDLSESLRLAKILFFY